MKILKDNYHLEQINEEDNCSIYKPYPRYIKCEDCMSELEYEESDIQMGVYGYMHVKCPLCGYDNMLEDNEHNITLTMNNIEFPTHFYHISKENGAIDCCNNEKIKEYLAEIINFFRNHKDEYSCGGHITGNLYLNVRRYADDGLYEVSISNDFYDTEIPFEEKDY